tara:strand:- start:27985 stop:28308 length:324 start_codon:yes stop_codon:yes gene_type:complete
MIDGPILSNGEITVQLMFTLESRERMLGSEPENVEDGIETHGSYVMADKDGYALEFDLLKDGQEVLVVINEDTDKLELRTPVKQKYICDFILSRDAKESDDDWENNL